MTLPAGERRQLLCAELLPFSPLSPPTLSPSFITSFSVFHLNSENGQIMFEIKWSKFARGWDDTPPHL
jgi:hypothetical protein